MTDPMGFVQALDKGAYETCPADESEYKLLWREHCASLDGFHAALLGGMLADRLSWVFVAAYQSAVRACFSGVPEGAYTSFAASEPEGAELPGTSLSEDGRLWGNKSWIASSRHVDHLVVSIGRSFEQALVSLAVSDGVHLKHRPNTGFLGDMTQGFARFDGVACTPVREHRAEVFRLAEPFFISVAGVGYLLRENRRLGDADMAERTSELLPPLLEHFEAGFMNDVPRLSALYGQVATIGRACSAAAFGTPGCQAEDWAANGRVLGMYGRALRGG